MAIVKVPSGSPYTSCTADAAANTKGAWAEMVASTSNAVKGFWVVCLSGIASHRMSIDIGTGAAASEVVLIADIHWSNGNEARGNGPCGYFPVSIPAGTRIAARVASSTGSNTAAIALHLVEGTGGGTCVTYGVTTNQGVQVDPGATANTKGAYSEITASTSADIAYLAIIIHMDINTAPAGASFGCSLATGGAGSEVDVVEEFTWSSNAGADHWTPACHTFPITIPSGTRLAVAARSTTNDATDRLFRVSIIGFSVVPT